MSDPDEKDDIPDDKFSSSRSGVGGGDVDTRENEEEEDSDGFFDAGEGKVVQSVLGHRIRGQPERWRHRE